MHADYQILDIDASNVDQHGFFCYMSKRKSAGYRQKRGWLERRFAEGLKIKILHETGGRDVAFIEYIPGERCRRPATWSSTACGWWAGGKEKGMALVFCRARKAAGTKHLKNFR